MRKLKLLMVLLLVGIMGSAFAQSSIEDVLKVNLRQTGAIKNGNEVSGYYLFYVTDKASKGNLNYVLEIKDTELNTVMTKKLTMSKYVTLLTALSNGRSMAFKFFDVKEKKVSIKGYDFEGKSVITKTSILKERQELGMYMQGSVYVKELGTAAIPGYGYVDYAPKKYDKLSYTMNFYPDKFGGKKWSKKGNGNKYEFAQFVAAIDSVIISLVWSREKMMSMNDMDLILKAHNAKDGKELFSSNLNDMGENLMVLNGTASSNGKDIFIYGLNFEEGQKISGKSKGLTKLVLNTKGEILEKQNLDWEKDFNVKSEEGEDFGSLFIHEFIPGANESTFLVAEQFSLNGGLSAVTSLLGGGTNIAFKIQDLLLIELDKEFNVIGVEQIEKKKTNFSMGGIPLTSKQIVGMYADQLGYMDFSYSQIKNEEGDFVIGYLDYDRKSKNKSMNFGGVTHTASGYTYDKISISPKGTESRVLQGKPGYVCLIEYTKKEKRLDLRLEKINF